MWDLIVSVPYHCLSFYLVQSSPPDCSSLVFKCQSSKMDQVVIASGSKRSCSYDTDFEKCLICQSSKNDPLYRLTAAGLETVKNALNERKDKVYDRLCSLI